MKPFKKILVPVDFSPHSEEALRVAVDLSRKYEGTISLVHVYEIVPYSLPEGYILYTPAQLTDISLQLEKLLVNSKNQALQLGASQAETKLLQGAAASEIVDYAKKNGIDLIVMGTHGRTGLKHVLLGSVAERVLRKAPCPVLSVHATDAATQ